LCCPGDDSGAPRHAPLIGGYWLVQAAMVTFGV
jgi:hypothetical protein